MKLIHLSFSPWSEKARWSLDHHRIIHHREDYLPMLGELGLRLKTRRWSGAVHVPVLVDGSKVIEDSLEIARYAERIGRGDPLFPDGKMSEILEWNDQCELLMSSGRARVTQRVADDGEAKLESLPPAFRVLGPLSDRVADLGVNFINNKYGLDTQSYSRHGELMQSVLDTLQQSLCSSSPYLLGDFSYADLAMASALQFLLPINNGSLGPASLATWEDPLYQQYPDLIQWRDELYAKHR